jgi:cholesterol oxidase
MSYGRTRMRFTERMDGHFAFDEVDPVTGEEAGRRAGRTISFVLTISTDDLDAFIADPDHDAVAHGVVLCDELGGRLPVQEGRFNLFVTEGPRARRMLYLLHFADGVGHPLTLRGHKEIVGGPLPEVWPQTSTLYTQLLQGHVGHEDDAPVVGAGVIHILPWRFAKQLTTFRFGGPGPFPTGSAAAAFARLFAGELWNSFVAPIPVLGPRA